MSNDRVPTSGLAPLVVGRAREFEGRVFLEEAATGRTLTFSHLGELTRRRAAELAAAHVPAQARVMIDVADPVNFCIEYLGVIAAGRCAVPVNPDAPDAELARTVATVEPAVLITDRPGRASALGLPALETPPRPLPPGRGGTTTLKRFGTPDRFGTLNRPGVSGGSVLLLTSGSTGAPKAVELTEQQLVYVAGGVARHNELTPADRGYSALPLFHINAQVVALLASLVAGSTLLVDRRFRRAGFWERLAQRDVTWINAVPAILTILAEYPVLARPARLRFIRSASAPLPAAVRQRVEAQASGARGGELRHDRGGQPDHRHAAGRLRARRVLRPGRRGRAAGPRRRRRSGAGGRPARSGCAARVSSVATWRAARPRSASTPTAGSTPATSATWTGTASCSWPAAATT